jgi:hypothetical protein
MNVANTFFGIRHSSDMAVIVPSQDYIRKKLRVDYYRRVLGATWFSILCLATCYLIMQRLKYKELYFCLLFCMSVICLCMIAQNAGPSLCSETCLTTSQDGNKTIDVKVEELTDAQNEDGPEPVLSAAKVDQEVSSMFVCPLLDIYCK